jgi:hypothetical protein
LWRCGRVRRGAWRAFVARMKSHCACTGQAFYEFIRQ